ncbi:MAG: hypothetical protein IPK82_15015 [Polyangiaceae bacterium]|nr:hypothetical protein [Polyangiaceae bacterium]
MSCDSIDSCQGTITSTKPPESTTVDCSGSASCKKDITCDGGLCTVKCGGMDACQAAVTCQAACACDVTCMGTNSCKQAVLCPFGGTCHPGKECASAPAGCNGCN